MTVTADDLHNAISYARSDLVPLPLMFAPPCGQVEVSSWVIQEGGLAPVMACQVARNPAGSA